MDKVHYLHRKPNTPASRVSLILNSIMPSVLSAAMSSKIASTIVLRQVVNLIQTVRHSLDATLWITWDSLKTGLLDRSLLC